MKTYGGWIQPEKSAAEGLLETAIRSFQSSGMSSQMSAGITTDGEAANA
jgi:hypothetical protein